MTGIKARSNNTYQSLVTSILAIITLNCCAEEATFFSKPTLFNNEFTGIADEITNETVYQVYFDREGYIYPNKSGKHGVDIKSTEFNKESGNVYGHLQRYFCTHPKELKNVADQAGLGKSYSDYKCEIDDNVNDGVSNAIKYSKKPSAQNMWLDQWQAIQEGLIGKQSEKIKRLLQSEQHKDSTIVVMLHGYNNTLSNIQKSYETARNTIRAVKEKGVEKYKDKKLFFVDIYWDGFNQKLPVSIWSKAQYTGPLVGLRLRKLLNGAIEQTRPVRILTHSSGAFVAGSLIGDSRKALELWRKPYICTRMDEGYDQATCRFKDIIMSTENNLKNGYGILKAEDVRVGMLAPATSAWTFTGGTNSGLKEGRGILKPSGKLRLIVGQHADDFANTKLLGLECYKGVTTLGVRQSSFCEVQKHVGEEDYKLNKSVDVHRVDFETKGDEPFTKYGFRADHAMKAYLGREKAGYFLSLLLDDDTVPNHKLKEGDNLCPIPIELACE